MHPQSMPSVMDDPAALKARLTQWGIYVPGNWPLPGVNGELYNSEPASESPGLFDAVFSSLCGRPRPMVSSDLWTVKQSWIDRIVKAAVAALYLWHCSGRHQRGVR